jgi:hypothetical protein
LGENSPNLVTLTGTLCQQAKWRATVSKKSRKSGNSESIDAKSAPRQCPVRETAARWKKVWQCRFCGPTFWMVRLEKNPCHLPIQPCQNEYEKIKIIEKFTLKRYLQMLQKIINWNFN